MKIWFKKTVVSEFSKQNNTKQNKTQNELNHHPSHSTPLNVSTTVKMSIPSPFESIPSQFHLASLFLVSSPNFSKHCSFLPSSCEWRHRQFQALQWHKWSKVQSLTIFWTLFSYRLGLQVSLSSLDSLVPKWHTVLLPPKEARPYLLLRSNPLLLALLLRRKDGDLLESLTSRHKRRNNNKYGAILKERVFSWSVVVRCYGLEFIRSL